MLPYICVPQLFLRREQQVDKQFKADETATPPATGICVLCSYVSACYYVYVLCVRIILYMYYVFLYVCRHATIYGDGVCGSANRPL